MAQPGEGTTLRHIRTLFNVGSMGGLTDGQLLERFTFCDEDGAELAFAALVERHGSMVLRICQSVLRERHDAEDALQATFLVLARKAASIRNQNSVVSWLHGVAFRVACCQKLAAARRRGHERKVAHSAVLSADGDDREDIGAVLHEELHRLPGKYREPIVLCYFKGMSHEQAARQLGWPVGTVRSRLARGREQLRGRLVRRGLGPSMVLLESALRGDTASAAIPAALARATARAAAHYASGRLVAAGVTSTSVALLAEGAMNMMFLSKVKFVLLACGLIVTGTLVVAQQAGTMIPDPKAQPATAHNPRERVAQSEADEDDAAVARDMGQLDRDILAEDVQALREQVEVTLRNKLRAERQNSPGASDVRSTFETARESYLSKVRELRIAESRLITTSQPGQPSLKGSVGRSKPGDDRVVRGPSANQPGPHPSAAVIGSIDMDAVYKRYEKVSESNRRHRIAFSARKNELITILSEARNEAQMLFPLEPGSEDYKRHENRASELNARHAAGQAQAEREFEQRRAEMTVALYKEIQETVTDLAKANGLTYVVKVSPGPRANSSPGDLQTALGSSVVYADSRNDLTDEVIRELNRRYKAAELEGK